MPNAVTGGYDFAAQFSSYSINRILAALHGSEVLQHSIGFLISDLPSAGGSVPPSRRTGCVTQLSAQIGAPTLDISDDATHPLLVHLPIRARNNSISGPSLPSILHGDVSLPISLSEHPVESGLNVTVDFSSVDPSQIAYAPAADSPVTDADALSRMLQIFSNLLSDRVGVQNPTAGTGALFWSRTKTYPRVFGLLANLQDAAPTESAYTEARDVIAESADFAFAVSSEFVAATAQARIAAFPVPPLSFSTPLASWNIALDLSGARVALHPGGDPGDGFDLVGPSVLVFVNGDATSGGFLGGGNALGFSFELLLALTPSVDGTALVFSPLPPQFHVTHGATTLVDLFIPEIEGLARPRLASLATAIPSFSIDASAFADILNLVAGGSRLRLNSVTVQTDSIRVTGSITFAELGAPVVDFAVRTVDLGPFVELNALSSWMPGGTVRSMTWQGTSVDGTRSAVVTSTAEFIKDATAPGDPSMTSWCMKLEGLRLGDGTVAESATVTGGGCSIVVSTINWAGTRYPFRPEMWFQGDPAPHWNRASATILDARSIATRGLGWGPALLLESYDGPNVVKLLSLLGQAKLSANLTVVAFLSDDQIAPELAQRRADVQLQIVHVDPPSQTAPLFEATLIDELGTPVWQTTNGAIDAASFLSAAEALKSSLNSMGHRQVALSFATGDLIPNVPFEIWSRQPGPVSLNLLSPPETMLADLSVYGAMLYFWRSDIPLSIEELKSLVADKSLAGDGIIVAVNDGEARDVAIKTFRALGINTAMLAIDPTRSIGSMLRVAAWPTTITLNRDLRIVAHHIGQRSGFMSLLP